MFCKNCGKEAEVNDKFCKNCGQKIEQNFDDVQKNDISSNTNKSEVVSSPIVENVNTSNNYSNDNTFNVNSTNSSTKVEKLKGLRIASLVLGIISLVFFLLNIVLLPLELTGLILAIVYIANNKKICAGVILNAIAMILSIAIFSLGTSALVSFANYVERNPDDFGKKVEQFIDGIDKQLDKEIENSFGDASKQIEDAKKELQKAKEEVKSTIENTKTSNSNKYSTGYKYVGSDDYGYIKVPESWVKFDDINPNDTIQYFNGGRWIATIYAKKDKDLTAYKYAKNVYDKVKNDGAKTVNLISHKIANKYYGYKVSCYYENIDTYLTCFIFSDSNNVKHYVAIEGPEKENDFYDLVNTFSLENK